MATRWTRLANEACISADPAGVRPSVSRREARRLRTSLWYPGVDRFLPGGLALARRDKRVMAIAALNLASQPGNTLAPVWFSLSAKIACRTRLRA